MKKNVLVFPCGSEIGLEVHKSAYVSTHFNLIGGSSVDDHGKFVYKNYIGDLPFVDDEDFTDTMNEIIKDNDIDFIIPAHDSVVLKLAEASDEGRLNCAVVTSPLGTCRVARSKRETYNTLSGVVPTPLVYIDPGSVNRKDFPVFLKPDVGQGSKGTYLAADQEDVNFYITKNHGLLALEYLPGAEYTVDCFTNKDGRLLFSEGRERTRISGGISVNSSRVTNELFQKYAAAINKALKFRGAWFFQLKESRTKKLVLMEVAPRIAGTMGLARAEGVNLVLLSLFDAMGYAVTVFKNAYTVTIDRALHNSYHHNIEYQHVYLDFDDLAVFEHKVNPAVIAFVYQCINQDKKVHLITRHKEDLHQNLKKFRLEGVFDDVIWIQDPDNHKYNYIKEKDAILIDDSFAEREEVQKHCGIPVFDGHMVESLMEKF